VSETEIQEQPHDRMLMSFDGQNLEAGMGTAI
jgi:hypothetical protein